MLTTNRSNRTGVRVVMHMSPSTYVAGVLSAQRRGLTQAAFLDDAVAAACAKDPTDPAHELPLSPHCIGLFLQVADMAPDAFGGPWRVLYAMVLQDEALWTAPRATVGDVESGMQSDGWQIDEAALTRAWPRLVSAAFL